MLNIRRIFKLPEIFFIFLFVFSVISCQKSETEPKPEEEVNKLIASAGLDQEITSPMHTVQMNAVETYSLNSEKYRLNFKWSIIEKPVGNNAVSIFKENHRAIQVFGLTEGSYKVQLEVKNSIGLSAYDTIEIKVLPDPLKGTIRVYEDAIWQRVGGPDGDYVAITIKEGNLSVNRFTGNTEVMVWDKDKNSWSDPNTFSWEVSIDGSLIIYNCWPVSDDYDDYYKKVGVKARVQLKIL